tara:strand:- start:651 stop:833 length:183 start_codon:yes stop_codon:yes gene_type:complete
MFFSISIDNSCEKSREVAHKKRIVNNFFIEFDFIDKGEQGTKLKTFLKRGIKILTNLVSR